MQHNLDYPTTNIHFFTIHERKIYNKWRVRILISIILGYATYYLCRQNFSIIMPALMEEFGYTKIQLGWVLTISSIVYGIGKLINGYLSDQSNARYFMPIGLFCSAISTFMLGFADTLLFLSILWIANNWFQSMGWPPVARMLTHWFAPQELGTKWALGAASHQIGGALTLILCSYLVDHLGWRAAFFVPSTIATLVAFCLLYKLRESPTVLNLPPVEAYKGSLDFGQKSTSNECLTSIQIIYKIFLNKKMWYVCFANMCLYIVRLGITYWAPLFLKEYKHVSITNAGWQVASFEIIGLLSGFVAGWASDKIFHGQRGPVGAIFMFALAVALFLFWKIPIEREILSVVALILIGFFVYGPQVLVGVASADFASKEAIGTANGLAGTFGYIGSGISGICVGFISDYWGWDASFLFFIASAFVGGVCFYLTSYGVKPR